MVKTRLLALYGAFLVGFAPMAAPAAPLVAPAYLVSGTPVHATGVFCMNLDGSSCTWGTGGGSGGGAVTAISGAYASGSIVDLGTGASPGANTTNGILKSLLAANSGLLGADGLNIMSPSNPLNVLLGAGSAVIGKVSQVDSGGSDATDTTNHAIKVNVVAGGAGGGVVTGPAASNAALSGAPVRIGCAFNTTLPTIGTTAFTADAQCDNRGGMFTTQEQAGVAQLWGTSAFSTSIANGSSTNLPITTVLMRLYSGTVNGYLALADPATVDNTGTRILAVGNIPTSVGSSAIAPVASSALEGCHVLKNAPGNLYKVSVAQGSLAGTLIVLNVTTAPTTGATVAPIWFQTVAASGPADFNFPTPLRGSVGLTVCYTIATTPFTYTVPGTLVAFSGQVL